MSRLSYKSLRLLCALFLLLQACKKDTQPANNNLGFNGAGTYSQPTTDTVFSGMFQFEKNIDYVKSPYSYSVGGAASAYFNRVPTAYYDTSLIIKIDSVSLNGYGIPLTNSPAIYSNYSLPVINTPINWNVSSHNGYIPSFTYLNYDNLPQYTGYALLPDTVSLNKPLTLTISGLYNMDSLRLTVEIGTNWATQQHIIVPKNSHSVSVTFPQYQVAVLSPSASGDIAVMVSKTYNRKIKGKNFSFQTGLVFRKYQVVFQ